MKKKKEKNFHVFQIKVYEIKMTVLFLLVVVDFTACEIFLLFITFSIAVIQPTAIMWVKNTQVSSIKT